MTSSRATANTDSYHVLIVCPGLSSPYAGQHRLIYDLLRSECTRRQKLIEVVTYPGQQDVEGYHDGILTPIGAATAICAIIARHENARTTYRLLGLSFGCAMSLAAAASMSALKFLEKIVLWGPIPYGMMWRSFAKGTIRADIGEGTVFPKQVKENFWDELIPMEHLTALNQYPLRICVGTRDRFVPWEIAPYLKALARDEYVRSSGGKGRNDIETAIVQECGHSVRTHDVNAEEYLRAVFQ